VLLYKEDQLIKLNDVEPTPNKIKSVCGVGTGIGISIIVPILIDNKCIYQVWPGEGGHCRQTQVTVEQ